MTRRLKADYIVTVLMFLIVGSFMYGAWQVNQQAKQINTIIDQQSPLIFAFQNSGTTGRLTFEVTCTRTEENKSDSKYVCSTKQTEPVIANVTPVPSPTATPRP